MSWDCPQANELRVFGSAGEAVLRVDRFDQLGVRTGRAFVPQAITTSVPADMERNGRRMAASSYAEAIYAQIVQMVRAIELKERPAVDGAAGERCVGLLESALGKATALPAPWLAPDEQAALQRLHWTHAS